MKAHRLVNEALKDVIAGIHGLQVSTLTITHPQGGLPICNSIDIVAMSVLQLRTIPADD